MSPVKRRHGRGFRRRAVVFAGAACRINALPDHVLTRAISFLDARQLVQTCVLSRRWRNLWRSVPRISASRDEFDGKAGTEQACDLLFTKFINRFLMLRNPVALDEFRLQYNMPVEQEQDPEADSEDANLWIRHALQSNVRLIEVVARFNTLFLDPAVFASKFCFLTSMLLQLVFLEPPFFKNLQRGCTVLERLVLHCCTIYDPEISSHTLKVLTIDDDSHCTFKGQASISIPSLIDLRFHADEARIPLLKNTESLVTASFTVGTNDDLVDDMCQFLWSLRGITYLDFNYRGPMLEMEQNLQWCPKFNNLTTLALGYWCLSEDFYPLIVFLQNSPNLERLTLESTGFYLKQRFIGDLEDRSFTCEHLVMVKISLSNLKSSKDDPVVNSLVALLRDNGITPDQISIKEKDLQLEQLTRSLGQMRMW